MTTLEAEKVEMPFGYYKGRTLGEIAAEDPLYLAHMVREDLRDFVLREAMEALVEKHRDTIQAKIAAGEKPKLFTSSQSNPFAGKPAKQLKLF